MPAQDLAKLISNGVIGAALAAFVIAGKITWETGFAVMAALLVPSSAPALLAMLRGSSSSKDGAS